MLLCVLEAMFLMIILLHLLRSSIYTSSYCIDTNVSFPAKDLMFFFLRFKILFFFFFDTLGLCGNMSKVLQAACLYCYLIIVKSWQFFYSLVCNEVVVRCDGNCFETKISIQIDFFTLNPSLLFREVHLSLSSMLA